MLWKHGSSPLTRGKRTLLRRRLVWPRLIPAHAGKTTDRIKSIRPESAHPRSRGENVVAAIAALVAIGSSPLTRGKRRTNDHRPCGPRLIPAHAGKTHGDAARRGPDEAHPRSRGENEGRFDALRETCGSSPLTRGKRAFDHFRERVERLIPAHAGKTRMACASSRVRRAHPRSRGENSACKSFVLKVSGSSPLTRGKRSGRTATRRS